MSYLPLVAILIGFAACCAWITTGRDPLWWMIEALIHTRAAIGNAWGHQVIAWQRCAATHPDAVRACRAEVGRGRG